MVQNLSYCFQFTEWPLYLRQINDGGLFIILAVVNTMFGFTALLSNAMIVAAILKIRSLHTPSSAFLCNLAVTDLLVGAINQPLFVAWLVVIHQRTAAPETECVLVMTASMFSYVFCGVSCCMVAATSFERFLCLWLHLRYPSLITVKRVLICCALIWLTAIVGALLTLIHMSSYNILASIVMVLLLAVTVFSYSQIYRILVRHRRSIKPLGTEGGKSNINVHRLSKSAWTFFYVFIAFLLCYLPYLGLIVYHEVNGVDKNVILITILSVTIIDVNSTLNPMLFMWNMRELRVGVLKLIRSVWSRDIATTANNNLNNRTITANSWQ